MSDSPDQIRADIERTRAELGADVDALADKVSPSKAMHRQADKVRDAVGSVRDRVMGSAEDVGDSVSEGFSHAKRKAEGSPLAVGLIAFGAGLLAAALIPASDKEKELAANVKEQAQPLMDEVTSAAKEVGEHLKEPAQDAMTAVKDSATEAMEHVKSDATQVKDDVVDRSKEAGENVSNS